MRPSDPAGVISQRAGLLVSIEPVADRSGAAREFFRVTRVGGFVGITEATWLEKPPLELVFSVPSLRPRICPTRHRGMKRALMESSLEDVVATSQRITARSESADRLRRLGLKHLVLTWLRALSIGLRSPEHRRLPKGALSDPKELLEYCGYGIYVGRK